MKKIKNSKGFTLMEMLIVVAIIAVLVAIAVPTFTASLNKARVATDEANIRAGYATLMAQMLTSDTTTIEGNYQLNTDGSITKDATGSYTTYGNAGATGITVPNIGGISDLTWGTGKHVQYAVTQVDGNITVNITFPD
ncbi:MAG: type II secretion system protein [Candidatus Faecousia sp.]|nr:type II secretion system protein [Candidatus Faecousia sp.]